MKKSQGGHGPRPPLAAACGAKAPTEGGREGRTRDAKPSLATPPGIPPLSVLALALPPHKPEGARRRATAPTPRAVDPAYPQRKTQTHTDNHRRATDRPSSTATPTTPRPQGTDHHLGARTPSTANLDQSRCGRAHPRAPRGRGGFPRGTGPRKTGEAAVREAPTRGQDRGARARAGTAEREEAASADARGRPGSRDAGRARHTDNRPHV